MPLPLQAPSNMFEGLVEQYLQQKQNAALMAQRKAEEAEKSRQYNAGLAETSKYHQDMLDLRRLEEDRKNKNLQMENPLKMDLLRAKIESEKQRANQLINKGKYPENIKQTPEQKLQDKLTLEKNKFNIKKSDKIETGARELKSMHDRALKLKKLIEENPDLTGIWEGGKAALNLSNNEKLAEFNQTAAKLQADMARYGSTRGGAQALKWAERAKPGSFKTSKYNLGMINSIINDAMGDYEELSSEYYDINGKPISIKLGGMEEESPKKSSKYWVYNKETGKLEAK